MLVVLRFVAALLLFILALLAIFRAPFGFLWKPAVAATAFGHLLAIIALGVAALAPFDRSSHISTALSLTAALLFFTPMIRGLMIADAVPAAFTEAFTATNGPALTLSGLFGGSPPQATLTRHVYKDDLHLDLYTAPNVSKPRPIVLAIHGGSWSGGDPTQLPDINHHLVHEGYAVAALRYRLAPTHRFPAQRDDIRGAITWLQSHAEELGLDPDQIVLLGRSAGGHLALTAAYTSNNPAIRGVIALYPAVDLHWSWANPSNPLVLDSHASLTNFLGGPPSEAPALYDAASPIQHLDPKPPPTLLFHGDRDELVSITQSRRLAARLRETKTPHLCVELPWATHGFDANLRGPGGQLYVWAATRFLAHVTQPPKPSDASR